LLLQASDILSALAEVFSGYLNAGNPNNPNSVAKIYGNLQRSFIGSGVSAGGVSGNVPIANKEFGGIQINTSTNVNPMFASLFSTTASLAFQSIGNVAYELKLSCKPRVDGLLLSLKVNIFESIIILIYYVIAS
jgi:hypothetical protein